MQYVVILGSTGSIGVSTLDVIAQHPDRYQVWALTCQQNIDKLRQQIEKFRPRYVVIENAEAARVAREQFKAIDPALEVLQGSEPMAAVASAPEVDTVMAAIVGAAGLESDSGSGACGQAYSAGQQRIAGDGGSAVYASGAKVRSYPAADRQRT